MQSGENCVCISWIDYDVTTSKSIGVDATDREVQLVVRAQAGGQGSVQMFEETMRAGYAAVVRLSGDPKNEELMGPCHGQSSLKAELEAMFKALEWLEERVCNGTAPAEDIVIFMDSICALEALEGQCAGVGRVEEYVTVAERLGVNS